MAFPKLQASSEQPRGWVRGREGQTTIFAGGIGSEGICYENLDHVNLVQTMY